MSVRYQAVLEENWGLNSVSLHCQVSETSLKAHWQTAFTHVKTARLKAREVKLSQCMKLKNIFYSHSLYFFVGILTSNIETKERRGGSRERISTSWVRSKVFLFLFEVVWGVR